MCGRRTAKPTAGWGLGSWLGSLWVAALLDCSSSFGPPFGSLKCHQVEGSRQNAKLKLKSLGISLMAAPTGARTGPRRQQCWRQPAHIIVKRHQQRLNLNFRVQAQPGLAWLICNSKPVSAFARVAKHMLRIIRN